MPARGVSPFQFGQAPVGRPGPARLRPGTLGTRLPLTTTAGAATAAPTSMQRLEQLVPDVLPAALFVAGSGLLVLGEWKKLPIWARVGGLLVTLSGVIPAWRVLREYRAHAAAVAPAVPTLSPPP